MFDIVFVFQSKIKNPFHSGCNNRPVEAGAIYSLSYGVFIDECSLGDKFAVLLPLQIFDPIRPEQAFVVG